MSFKILIEQDAENDIDEAFIWYEMQKSGLGFEFIIVLNESFEKLIASPLSYPKIYKNVRKFLLKKFPYSIFYIVEEKNIQVLSVFHSHRNPTIWKRRN